MQLNQQGLQRHKIMQTLQNCKQIPKDDRLILRKHVLENNNQLRQILLLKDIKKMQIKLRKFLINIKTNGKKCNQHSNAEGQLKYPNTLKPNNSNNAKSSIYGFRKSVDCIKKRNLEQSKSETPFHFSQIRKSFNTPNKKYIEDKKNCKSMIHSFYNESSNKENKTIQRPKINNFKNQKQERTSFINKQSTLKESNFQSLKSSIEKVEKSNISTPFQSRLVAPSNTYQQQNSSVFTDPKIMQECKSFLNKIGIQSIGNHNHFVVSEVKIFDNSQVFINNQTQISLGQRIRSLLLGIDSQTLFDGIITEKVKQNFRTPQSFFVNFEQFYNLLSQFLLQKNLGPLNKYNEEFIEKPQIFAPFQNSYQCVDLRKVIQFITTYTASRLNPIRTLYLQLDRNLKGEIKLQDFIKQNEWRGNQIVQSFKQLVNFCGKWNESITYWEMYWAKNSTQLKQFREIYNFSFC